MSTWTCSASDASLQHSEDAVVLKVQSFSSAFITITMQGCTYSMLLSILEWMDLEYRKL